VAPKKRKGIKNKILRYGRRRVCCFLQALVALRAQLLTNNVRHPQRAMGLASLQKLLANDERLCEDFSQLFGKKNSTIIAF